MDSRIVLVGLDNQIVKDICIDLAEKMSMFFLDINDLIKYNFSDTEETINKVGIDYFEKQIKKLAISCCDYENTIISCPYDLLFDEEILQCFKLNAIIIFIKISKEFLNKQTIQKTANEKLDIQILAYKELTKQLESFSNINIIFDEKNFNNNINEIIEKIKNK